MFSSVIASAPATLSKDKFLASVESSNSSRGATMESVATKIGKSKESHATARKALGAIDTAIHEAAVPPLSPPGVDGESLF